MSLLALAISAYWYELGLYEGCCDLKEEDGRSGYPTRQRTKSLVAKFLQADRRTALASLESEALPAGLGAGLSQFLQLLLLL